MMLWTAFLLGLVGSLHCAGMCGPLVLALPITGRTTSGYVLGRVTYHAGRLAAYGVLGAVFGLAGRTIALAGLQRAISVDAGSAILISLAMSSRRAWGGPAVKAVVWLKSAFAKLLQQRTLPALFALGSLNGLLPCGLVYVACAAATTAGGFVAGVESMLLFGMGTLPMMLGLGLAGNRIHLIGRLKLQRLVPVSLLAVGTLLILRGMSLGIPYISPDLMVLHNEPPTACH